ncbi:hypothetical protein LSAT2_011358, partial [Lamellibrachia satsuma]
GWLPTAGLAGYLPQDWLVTYRRFGSFVNKGSEYFLCLRFCDCQQNDNVRSVINIVFADSRQIQPKLPQKPFLSICKVSTGYLELMWWF